MESAKSKYQIEDYSVGQTTLEQVKHSRFLGVIRLWFSFHYSYAGLLKFCQESSGRGYEWAWLVQHHSMQHGLQFLQKQVFQPVVV